MEKSSLIFELRFGELVNMLPPSQNANGTDFKIRFETGSKEEFDAYLLNNNSAYPLVWLIPPYNLNNDIQDETISGDASFFIAMNNTKRDNSSLRVLETDFKLNLKKIEYNLIKALKNSSISSLDRNYKSSNIINKNLKKQENMNSVDVINLIKIKASIEFNSNCLRPIIF